MDNSNYWDLSNKSGTYVNIDKLVQYIKNNKKKK